MSRTATVLLNNFLRVYENPIPYIPQTRTLQLVLKVDPPPPPPPPPIVEPVATLYTLLDLNDTGGTGLIRGPTGPAGKSGNRFSSITKSSVLITPSSGIVMLQVGKYLSYIYGTPVYVSSAEIYTNNFKGKILAYDSSTGYMTIGNITNINGTFGTYDMYTVNAQVLTSIGPQGGANFSGFMGMDGPMGPTGPTGPQVPFSGGNSAYIAISMFQYGFDCGDVE